MSVFAALALIEVGAGAGSTGAGSTGAGSTGAGATLLSNPPPKAVMVVPLLSTLIFLNPFSCKILLIQLLSKASWEKYRLFLSISLVFSRIEYKSYFEWVSYKSLEIELEHCRILVILFSLSFSSHSINAPIHPNVL